MAEIDLKVLCNALGTIAKCVKERFEQTGETLPSDLRQALDTLQQLDLQAQGAATLTFPSGKLNDPGQPMGPPKKS